MHTTRQPSRTGKKASSSIHGARDDSRPSASRPSALELAERLEDWREQALAGRDPRRQWRLAMSLAAPVVAELYAAGVEGLAERIERALEDLRSEWTDEGRADAFSWLPSSLAEGDDEVVLRLRRDVGQLTAFLRTAQQLAEQTRPPRRSDGNRPRTRPRITKEEANARAREILRESPGITARKLSERIGCSLGLISKLSAWKAVRERRERAKPPAAPKAVSLESPEAMLQRLKEEQQKDGESDGSIRPFEPGRPSHFHLRRKP